MKNFYQFELSTGTLSLNINKQVLDFNELVSVGERINPKRPFIFVSKVIGRYVPTSLKMLNHISETLVNQIPLDSFSYSNVSVVSLSETALGLGSLVHHNLNKNNIKNLNVFTTRHKSDQEIFCSFDEPHSHLPNHYIYSSSNDEIFKNTEILILVDDEITTGNTLKNLYEGLSKDLKHIKKVILLTLTDWSNKSFKDWNIPVEKYSLIEGSYSWLSNNIPLKKLPYNNSDYASSILLDMKDNFRNPSMNFFNNNNKIESLKKDLYVIYYNELLPYCLQQYIPYLDSEHDVWFLGLSSSPIELDSKLILTKAEFKGFYSNIPVYLYNAVSIFNKVEQDLCNIIFVTEPNHIPFSHH